MKAYIVVGPTNVHPRFRRSLLRARDSSVVAICISASFVIRRGRDFAVRLPPPEVGSKRAALVAQLVCALRVVDCRFDLSTVPDDGLVSKQASDVARREARDAVGIEVVERAAEGVTLPEDRQPAQAGLETLEAHLFEEAPVVRDRPSPLLVVIPHIERIRSTPPAANQIRLTSLENVPNAAADRREHSLHGTFSLLFEAPRVQRAESSGHVITFLEILGVGRTPLHRTLIGDSTQFVPMQAGGRRERPGGQTLSRASHELRPNR